jgi:protein-arginine deiminase
MNRSILLLVPGVLLLAACPPPLPEFAMTSEGYSVESLQVFPGLSAIPNIDDDNVDGTPDWDEEGGVEGDDDRSYFQVPAEVFERLKTKRGEYLQLDLGGAAGGVRITQDGRLVLGERDGPNLLTHFLTDTESAHRFEVEFAEALTTVTVTLSHRDDDDEVLASFTLWITAGSMLLNHHLQQTEHVWVMDLSAFGSTYNNRQMVGTFEDVLDDQFTAFSAARYAGDIWIQDEVQFGWYASDAARIDVVIDSIRDRGLDDWPEVNFDAEAGDGFAGGPDVIIGTWGYGQPNSLDSFGNLEVSPPLGADYPHGRAFYGGSDSYHPARAMTDYLADQLIQDPFRVDTSWLCVGHVDEFTSFVPDPTAPRGFRFVYADTVTAWEVLEEAESVDLPKYRQSYGIDTTHDFVNDTALRDLNDDLQEDVLDPILERFIDELGLSPEEILPMPSLFEEAGFCGGDLAALIPGMVNMIVANRGNRTDVFLADPFTRNSANADFYQEDDPIIQFVESTFPETLDFHFVDNWNVYHLGLGEVHCGTNMTRTPPNPNWWATSGHLIEDEVLN